MITPVKSNGFALYFKVRTPIKSAEIIARIDAAVTICPVTPTGRLNVPPISINNKLEMIKRASVANPVINNDARIRLMEGDLELLVKRPHLSIEINLLLTINN